MRGWWLFARAHSLSWSLAVVAGCCITVGLAGHRSMAVRYGSGAGIPYATFLPALAGIAIATSSRSTLHHFDRVAARSMAALRSSALVGQLLFATAGLAMSISDLPPPVGLPGSIRNLLGLTGLGLIGARWLGGRLAWVLPTALLITVISLANTVQDASSAWVWLIKPDGDLAAAGIAVLLLTVGMLLVAVGGTREPADEIA